MSFILGFCGVVVTAFLLVLGVLGVADRLLLVAGLVVANERALVALLIDLPERLRLRVAQVLLLEDLRLREGVIRGGRGGLGDRLDGLLGRRGRRGLGRNRLRRSCRRRGRLLGVSRLLEVGGRHLLRRGLHRSRRRGRHRCRRRADELGDEGLECGLVLVDDVLRRCQVLDAGRLVLREAVGVRDLDLGDVGRARLEERGGLALGSVRVLLLLRRGLGLGLHGLDRRALADQALGELGQQSHLLVEGQRRHVDPGNRHLRRL